MTRAEKCIAWFNENGVHAWSPTQDETVMIMINDLEISVSSSEIEFRACLYDDEKGGDQ